MRERPLERERPAADDQQHGRRPGRDDGLEQLLLAAEEPEVAPVAGLAGGRVVRQPGPLADDDDRRPRPSVPPRRPRRSPRRCRRAGPCPRRTRSGRRRSAPAARPGSSARPPASSVGWITSLDGKPNGLARWRSSAQRLDVRQVRVVAHEVPGAVGDRPDDRDPPAVGRQRQHAVVLEQHDRPPDELGRERALLRLELVQRGDRRRVHVRPLEQPEPELEPQDALDREVDDAAVDPPVRDRRAERLAEPGGRRQLAVEPGPERPSPRPCPGRRSGGARRRASGPPCSPRRRCRRSPTRRGGSSSAARARRGRARRRRRSRPASRSRARPRGRRPRTATAARRAARAGRRGPAPGSARPRPARGRPGACRSRRRRSRGRRPGCRARRRQPSAAARYGSSPYVSSIRPQRGSRVMSSTGASASRAPIASIRRRIVVAIASTSSGSNAAAAPIDCWNDGRAAGEEAVERLLVEDRRDPEPRLLDEEALDRVAGLGRPGGVEVRRAGHPADLADPVGEPVAHALRVELGLAAEQLERPERPELGELLVERHPREQVGDARVDRQRRRRGSGPRSSSSALHRAGRQAADDAGARRWRRRSSAGIDRDDRVREDPGLVRRVLGREVHDPERQRPLVGAVEHDQRQEERVPGRRRSPAR